MFRCCSRALRSRSCGLSRSFAAGGPIELFITGDRVPSYLDLPPCWPPAPYGHMPKPYHPSYTDVNPAARARGYTSEQVHCRKVSLIYDWLPPDRDVEAWFRRVPYRLERDAAEGSWVVKYFEFRAPIKPLPQVGFIGDLWISWNVLDPSIWFKVHENEWERWGGCASSVREVSLSSSSMADP